MGLSHGINYNTVVIFKIKVFRGAKKTRLYFKILDHSLSDMYFRKYTVNFLFIRMKNFLRRNTNFLNLLKSYRIYYFYKEFHYDK